MRPIRERIKSRYLTDRRIRKILVAMTICVSGLSESKAVAQSPSPVDDMAWTWSGTGLTNPDVHLLAGIDRPGSKHYAGGSSGIFASTDGGESWQVESFAQGVSVLTLSPADPNVVFAIPQSFWGCWYYDQ